MAAKHWGTPITWTVCAEWSRTPNYHSKNSLRSFKTSGCLLSLGAEPWSAELPLFGMMNPMHLPKCWAGLGAAVLCEPASSQAADRALLGSAQNFGRHSTSPAVQKAAPTDTRAGQAQAEGDGLREWEKTMTFALFITQNWAALHRHKKFVQTKAKLFFLKRNPPKG